MPFNLKCYNGHPVVADDDQAGRTVRCPACSLVVPVPKNPPVVMPVAQDAADESGIPARPAPTVPDRFRGIPVEDEPVDDEDEPEKQADPFTEVVRLGLAFHYARMVVFLLAVLAVLLVMLLPGAAATRPGRARPVTAPELAAVVLLAAVWLTLLQAGLALIGSALCAFAPARAGARALILASLACDVFGMAAGAALAAVGEPPLLASPFSLASWVLFLMFLKALAVAADHPGSVNEARGVLFYGVLLYLVPLAALAVLAGLAFLFVEFGRANPKAFFLLGGLVVFVWLFLSIKYTFTLIELIGTLRDILWATRPRRLVRE